MPITFGSVGDIIAVGELIQKLIKLSKESRDSPAEYQEVVREIHNLDRVVLDIDLVLKSSNQSTQVVALDATADHCLGQIKRSIAEYSSHITKYRKTLGGAGSSNFVKDSFAKFRWPILEKEKLAKFRQEVQRQCSSLNVSLAAAILHMMNMQDEKLEVVHRDFRSSSAAQVSLLHSMDNRLDEKNALIETSSSNAASLASSVDYIKNTVHDILSYARNILDVNRKIYHIVVSIQNQLPARLDKFWTQEPALLEDALGRVTTIHVEFVENWEAFHTVLEIRFRQLPGHRKIQNKEYVLRANAATRDIETSTAFNCCFLPGRRIIMSMIFEDRSDNLSSCPGCKFVTAKTENELDLQVQCPNCKMEYQRVIETTVPEPRGKYPLPPKADDPNEQPSNGARSKKRQLPEDGNDEEELDGPANFRRVRMRHAGQDHKADMDVDLDDTEIARNAEEDVQDHKADMDVDLDDPEIARAVEEDGQERKKKRAENRERRARKKERAEKEERRRRGKEPAERTVRKSTGDKAPRRTTGGKGPARKSTGGKAPRTGPPPTGTLASDS